MVFVISAVIQIGLLTALLVIARDLAQQYRGSVAWRRVWIFMTTAVLGLMEWVLLVTLFAVGIEPAVLRYAGRYLVPIQVYGGLFAGLYTLRKIVKPSAQSWQMRIRLPHPVGFILDNTGVVSAWDAGATDLFGWTESEAIGKEFHVLVSPESLCARHRDIVTRYLASGLQAEVSSRYVFTCRYRDATDEFFPVEIILSPERIEPLGLQVRGVARRMEVNV